MQKRGQVTVFVIIGIVVIAIIAMGIFLRKDIASMVAGRESAESTTFQQQAEEVRQHVKDCLKEALIGAKEAMPSANIAPEDYNAQLAVAVADRAEQCLNFRQFEGLEITSERDMAVEIVRNVKLTTVGATVRFKVDIQKGEQSQSYSEFGVSLKNTALVGDVA